MLGVNLDWLALRLRFLAARCGDGVWALLGVCFFGRLMNLRVHFTRKGLSSFGSVSTSLEVFPPAMMLDDSICATFVASSANESCTSPSQLSPEAASALSSNCFDSVFLASKFKLHLRPRIPVSSLLLESTIVSVDLISHLWFLALFLSSTLIGSGYIISMPIYQFFRTYTHFHENFTLI